MFCKGVNKWSLKKMRKKKEEIEKGKGHWNQIATSANLLEQGLISFEEIDEEDLKKEGVDVVSFLNEVKEEKKEKKRKTKDIGKEPPQKKRNKEKVKIKEEEKVKIKEEEKDDTKELNMDEIALDGKFHCEN